ncbi:MAG: hypothetical protein HYZ91_00875 [Candidatus Omnitrophica bacterium]|nr:hypothetical protein [Candidatus Omnitrophota bacterium]
MGRLKVVGVGGLLAIGLAVLWGGRSVAQRPGGQGIFCDFERVQPWDISPEQGFSLSLSEAHATHGRYALKVTFPQDAWPSINTRKLRQPITAFDALTLDVFNPQEETVPFAIRLDDRSGHRVAIDSPLSSGLNHVRIPRASMARLDTRRLAFVVLFLQHPQQTVTLYFDNMRLVAAPPVAQLVIEHAATSGEPAREPAPSARRPAAPLPATLPKPPQRPPAPATGALTIPVVKLREGGSPQSLVSNGIPFAPGQLKTEQDVAFFAGPTELPVATRVLARWPQDGSIRSLLVQFHLDVDQAREPIVMKWGQRRTIPPLSVIEVSWELPEAFLMLPPRWLCDSQIIGEQVPMYDHEFPAYDERIKQYFPARRDDRLTGDIGNDDYYDTAHVFYQLYARSGDPDTFAAARKEAIRYRDQEILHEGPERGRHRKDPKTRYVYVEAMADDYLLTGDERSRAVAKEMADYLRRAFDPAKAFYPKEATNFWTEREVAFPFLGILTYYELSGEREYLAVADQIMEQLSRLQRQWPQRGGFIHNLYAHDPEEGARPDEYGGSPFMAGLLLEPIVEYHRLTGSPQAAQSIFMALDWLMREGLAPSGDAFLYLTSDNARAEGEDHPDLNFLIVHGFGYGYRLSGYARTDYLELGRKLLERGIRDARLSDRKHFNQNYRSSGHFLAYIARPPHVEGDISPQAPAATPAATSDVLWYAADFDDGTDGWVPSRSDVVLERDQSSAYSGRGALKVRSTAPGSEVAVGRSFDGWNLDAFPLLRFAYKIPPGIAIGLRCQTAYEDWVTVGEAGTDASGAQQEGGAFALLEDDQWHEVTVDMRAAIRRVLPGVAWLKACQCFSRHPVEAGRAFLLDQVAIGR